jgi:Thioredoxin like C-terminal domain
MTRGPHAGHGKDNGVVTEPRPYQLVRQGGSGADHSFEIEFLDPGVETLSFTFG